MTQFDFAPPARAGMGIGPDDTPAPTLSRRRKAAVILQLLLSDGQKLSLSTLPEDQQLAIARELGSLRVVDKATLEAIAREFSDELEDVGLSAAGTLDGALAALTGQISPAAVARLRDEHNKKTGNDPWSQIVALDPEDMVPLMTRESIEICAVTLSKLAVSKAAKLLGLLPGERARRITFAMSQTAGITPESVLRIGHALVADYGTRPSLAFATPPSQRVGAILNSSQAETRETMLTALTADDPAFAEQVRKSIFTFPDIPARVKAADIPKIIRGLDSAALVTALAGAMAEGGKMTGAVEYLLSNMSQRMADQLREEIKDRGRVRKTDAEGAQSDLVTAIRDLADKGEISLSMGDDSDG